MTSKKLVEESFKVIGETKKLNTLISDRYEDAIKEAKEIDKRIANGEKLPVLAGVPIIVKDNI